MSESLAINAEFPPKLIAPLFAKPVPTFRVFYGGRSSGKSWSIVRYLLLESIKSPLRILAVRQFMSAIDSSVHKLISDQIGLLGLRSFFRVEQRAIYGSNGTEIRFAGIHNNIDSIRSFEGVDVTYCEESEGITKDSWEVLIPTVIRKPGSCMIISLNPGLSKADSFQRWIVHPPKDCIVTKINFLENPFTSPEVLAQAEHMRLTDVDAYNNVWLGFPLIHLEHAVFGKELRAAQAENRLTRVPYDPSVSISTYWDLGRADRTAIIFAQYVSMEFRVVDYVEDFGLSIHDYIKLLQAKPFVYNTHFLPHDAKAKQLGSKRSVEEILRGNGERKVRIVPRLSVQDGIAAAKLVWPNVWIDEFRCARLIECLREFRYDMALDRPAPIHDEFSHAADAFRYMAVALQPEKPKTQVKYNPEGWNRFTRSSNQAWMDI